ncbi:MAG: sulfotransferase family protein [Thermodesulfobacteriota bacterium]
MVLVKDHNDENQARGTAIIVVTGLPRSGTSMMMQMLEAGGAVLLSDGLRRPDAANPKGYYEYEPVKRLAEDNSWLVQARGRAVKIVAPLLPHLAPNLEYRVIFMERDLEEVLRSQRAMLERLGRRPDASEEKLGEAFRKHLVLVRNFLVRSNLPTLFVQYRSVVRDPLSAAVRVNRFLGGIFDPEAMARAVSPELYRQRRETSRDRAGGGI